MRGGVVRVAPWREWELNMTGCVLLDCRRGVIVEGFYRGSLVVSDRCHLEEVELEIERKTRPCRRGWTASRSSALYSAPRFEYIVRGPIVVYNDWREVVSVGSGSERRTERRTLDELPLSSKNEHSGCIPRRTDE